MILMKTEPSLKLTFLLDVFLCVSSYRSRSVFEISSVTYGKLLPLEYDREKRKLILCGVLFSQFLVVL